MPEQVAQGNSEEEVLFEEEGISWNAYPNPATNKVVISYTLPEEAKNPVLLIYDSSGKQVLAQDLTSTESQYIWNAGTLTRGVYFYTLKYDDQIKETKQVLLTR